MPGTKPIPDPELDHGMQDIPPNPAPWTPPAPPDPAAPWIEIPLDGNGNPNWPAAPGYPNGPWDPMSPKPGPHGRKITYNPKFPKAAGGTEAVLRIHCGGGEYQVPWANLCNPDAPPKPNPHPPQHCNPETDKGLWTEIQVNVKLKKYICEIECSVQITCTVEYTSTTQEWKCVGNTWQAQGAPTNAHKCSERSYIFQCC
jgi:hypothetical protein